MRAAAHCNKCGMCCSGFDDQHGVLLLAEDISRLCDQLVMTESQFKLMYVRTGSLNTSKGVVVLNYLQDIEGRCVFLKENECSIHDIQPLQCNAWPGKDELSRYGRPEGFACYSMTQSETSDIKSMLENQLKTLFDRGNRGKRNASVQLKET